MDWDSLRDDVCITAVLTAMSIIVFKQKKKKKHYEINISVY